MILKAFIAAVCQCIFVIVFGELSISTGYAAVYETSIGAVLTIVGYHAFWWTVHNCSTKRASGAKDENGYDIYEDDPHWVPYWDISHSNYATQTRTYLLERKLEQNGQIKTRRIKYSAEYHYSFGAFF